MVKSADGIEWTEGDLQVEDINTALKRKLKSAMPDGNYIVYYSACFVNSNCEKNQFSFKIDSAKKIEHLDLRAKKEVEIRVENLKFSQQKILISAGTKVVWINDDTIGHFVNTETHPEHTYYPIQNSKELQKNDTFSIIFETAGQYNYHCSAHYPQKMVGSIIVED